MTLNNPEDLSGVEYKWFSGSLEECIPRLSDQKYNPISVYGLLKRQMDLLDSDPSEEVISTWKNLFSSQYEIITGDGVCFHPRGKVKIVLDAPIIRNLPSEIELYKEKYHDPFFIPISNKSYRKMEGLEMAFDDFVKESFEQPTNIILNNSDPSILLSNNTWKF